jgi:hypothetical protein
MLAAILQLPRSGLPVIDAGWGYNATLWVLLAERPLACFRVHADGSGHITSASVADFGQLDASFDQTLRRRLLDRYGAHCEILVHVDGGNGFARFRRGGLPEPSQPPIKLPKQQRLDL